MKKTRLTSSWKMNYKNLTFTLEYDGLLDEHDIEAVDHDFKVDARLLASENDYDLEFVDFKWTTYEEDNLRGRGTAD